MYLRKVTSRKDIRRFLNLPDKIYKGNPNYIRPLDNEIEQVFDVNRNACFQNGKCERWILLNDRNEIIGRIAAFINNDYQDGFPIGGIGFFECIDSQKAADYMFDYCKEWLQNQDIKAMDGPINFGDRMKWWGLLTDGFQPPLYGMNYNPPYYQKLFENYGFSIYFRQHCYSIDLKARLQQKFYTIKDVLTTNPSYELRQFSKNNIPQFAKDFVTIYNKAWQNHQKAKIIDEKEVVKIFNKMNSVIDEKTIWFAYHNNQPIGCWLNLPDLNDYFGKVNSKFGLFSFIKFLWLKKFRKTKRLIGLVFGVIPEFQNKGIDAYIIVKALETMNTQTLYNSYEVQWIGDFNSKMLRTIENLGAKPTRTLATYRYLFDQNVDFIPHFKF
jgi:hypothetical protein